MSRTRIALGVGIVVVGVTTGTLLGPADDGADDQARLQGPIAEFAATARAGTGLSRQVLTTDLAEMLPNVRYELPGQAPFTQYQLVVLGRVVAVEAGVGYVEDVDDEIPDSDSILLSFEDPDAQWRTAHLTVEVDEVIAGNLGGASTVRVGLGCYGCHDPATLDTAVAELERSLQSMGTVLLFLFEPPAVYTYDPTLWAIGLDGGMIGFVQDDGSFTLPLLEPELAEMFLADSPDLDTLRAAARQPTKVIEFVIGESGLPERVDTEPLDADG